MTEKRILFGNFEFPRTRGLKYVLNEEKSVSDYLFVNEAHDKFSMYFEDGFPVFKVPENAEADYALFELRRSGRLIKFFCPEKRNRFLPIVLYFYVELFDENGICHKLPGQVRMENDDFRVKSGKDKAKIIQVLESVTLVKKTGTA